jgi:ABC-type antimicrobial peptide transport system permease subunit
MMQLVSSRTSEIGIRLTLGAAPTTVLRQVLGEGLLHASLGLAIGLGVSLLVMRGLTTLLYDVAPTDLLTLSTVGVTLLVVAAVACLAPARRAMRIDPVEALRLE